MKILITTGPTREFIDPVRFISNRSTGTIGFCIAKAAKAKKYKVILISGPTHLEPPAGVKFIPVETAEQMKRAVLKNLHSCDCVFMTAAVCDFRPARFSKSKIKKPKYASGTKKITLELKQNSDILEAISKGRKKQKIIGFALETEDLIKNATKKLKDKKLDFIVANKVSKSKNPFGERKTDAVIIGKKGIFKELKGVLKAELAKVLLGVIE